MISSKPPFALSNEEQIWTCLRKQREEEIKKKGKEGEQGNKWEGRKEKGKGKKERGKKKKQPSSHLSSFDFSSPKQLD